MKFKFNKTAKAGLIIAGCGLGLGILICIISLIGYGEVYFFNGYLITAIGWVVVIFSVLVGCMVYIIGALSHMRDFSKQLHESNTSTLQKTRENANATGAVYYIEGVRGRILTVYDDKVIITTRLTAGSFLTGNATDGEKTIYFVDCIGIQFKKCDLTLGYIQFETASGIMNNKASNMFNENSFTWDLSAVSNEKMEEIANYVKGKINDQKHAKASGFSAPISPADELKKMKELLDSGIISQEEFDAKKKQLLGL